MDNAWRWFFSGILVGLICTALALVVIDPVGRFGLRAPGLAALVPAPAATAEPAGERTFILVVDESGRVVSQRVELAATPTAAPAAPGAPGEPGAPLAPASPPTAAPTPTPGLVLGKAILAKVEQPSFIAAREGTAYVATRKLELKKVDYKGAVSNQSVDGIKDLGASRIADVDVTGDGTLFALVIDGPFEWRVFKRAASANTWTVAGSASSTNWPAEVQAMAVTDGGAVYLSAADPGGVFRMEPDGATLRPWVEGGRALGIDSSGDDSRLLYVSPEAAPRRAEDQVKMVQGGVAQRWLTTYAGCADGSTRPMPSLPRDVAVLPLGDGSSESALIVDSNNVVWYQQRFGVGYPVFGVPCESGNDSTHLNGPRGVAVDNLGNVFISDAGNGRVVVLPKPGAVPAPAPKGKATPKATEQPDLTPVPTPPSTSGPAPAPLTFVDFGNPGACPNGRCPEADVMLPKDVTVGAGESVRFNIRAQSHQVAIFAPGTRVEDINTNILAGVPGTPGPILIDSLRRVAESPARPFQQPAVAEWDWDTRGLTPGAYLVICTFKPHFDTGMTGTVVIQ